MKKLLCPSMMCADFGCLREEVARLEEGGADIFHLDVMDGCFVPNFGMGLQDIEWIARAAKIPCDVHLMIADPGKYVETFAAMGVKIIYIHPEADLHPPRTLQKIADAGAVPGIAINPGTTAEQVEPLLNLAGYVLVMTVNPGFARQAYLNFVDEKLEKLSAWKKRYGFQLLIDGACSSERIATLAPRGVDGFVLGTSALFGKGRPYKDILTDLRNL